MARPRGSKRQRAMQARLQTGAGRLLGYVRVSTLDQANGHSLDGQRDRLRDACERAGYTLVDVVEDVASGAKERDGLKDAQARIDAGEAEGLVFAKLDRITRSLAHGARLVEWARDNGITLLSSDEGGVMVKQGELVNEALPVFLAIAQMERERISRRTREGLAVAKAKGKRLGGPQRRETTDPLVKRAVRLREKGMTTAAIADLFNEEGETTARGNAFSPMAVWRYVQRAKPEANPEGGYPNARAAAVA